jgi:hypothetical protein
MAASPDDLRHRPWAIQAAPPEALSVPTMLSDRERGLLYWLARYYFSGAGWIVDAGPFLGGSTVALACGLVDQGISADRLPIASYDRFVVEAYTLARFGAYFPIPEVGRSFRPAFDRHIARVGKVEVREGDFCALGWSGEPIEILFLDLVKTWRVHEIVWTQFLPCLIPGRSVIVQQDYLWGYGPWIHLAMELLADCLEILDGMPNGSVAYLLTAPIPAHVASTRIREDLTADEQLVLMDNAVARWEGENRGMVELARVMLMAELGDADRAAVEFHSVCSRYAQYARVEASASVLAAAMRWEFRAH